MLTQFVCTSVLCINKFIKHIIEQPYVLHFQSMLAVLCFSEHFSLDYPHIVTLLSISSLIKLILFLGSANQLCGNFSAVLATLQLNAPKMQRG